VLAGASAPGPRISICPAFNVYAEVDLETKAQMLAACGSFTAGKAPAHRWRDDPYLMQFLRNL
jgi:hypothetical protein